MAISIFFLITTTCFSVISATQTPPPTQPPSLPPIPPPAVSTARTPPPLLAEIQESKTKTPPPAQPSLPVIPPPPPPPPAVSTARTLPPPLAEIQESKAKTPPPTQPSLPVIPPPPPVVSTARTPPPPPPLAESQDNQLNNIIDALIGTGDFVGWANLLSSTDPSLFPLTATLFIPSNDAVSHFTSANTAGIDYDPFLIPYHIIPQRLTFSDLQQFTVHTRLPTLLPSKYIVITNNSPSNFTVDDSQITRADIFVNVAFSVHGIKKVLDYSVYGGNNNLLSPPPGKTKSPRIKPTPGPPKKERPVLPAEIIVGLKSCAPCSRSEILMIFSAFCAVFIFKIL
ncbi:hypothetical protein Salat_0363600 [Sesamum alatum]|uniref:FAS1 domain-containing protein n=1 Tax=Sesamum alatum TaxID=300844 RepID=A0AAE1Z1W0_9LAMI|nr:hypothetical protein Salat_0363600 [Sesamum alatum]